MEQPKYDVFSQDEVRRIIINDMVKKRNSIVPVIGEDAVVYKDKGISRQRGLILRVSHKMYLGWLFPN